MVLASGSRTRQRTGGLCRLCLLVRTSVRSWVLVCGLAAAQVLENRASRDAALGGSAGCLDASEIALDFVIGEQSLVDVSELDALRDAFFDELDERCCNVFGIEPLDARSKAGCCVGSCVGSSLCRLDCRKLCLLSSSASCTGAPFSESGR